MNRLEIEIEVLKSLVLRSAEGIGPMTMKYIKAVDEDTFSIDYDWYILAKIFYFYTEPLLLERACQRAIELNILDPQKFEIMLSMMNSCVIEEF